MGILKKIITVILPWPLRRKALNKWFGYDIHPSAKIGLAWVFPSKLTMKEGSKIDHFTIAVHLDSIEMREKSSIGRSNWITGFSSGTDSRHFKHQPERRSNLILGRNSAITKNHHIDCTNIIQIGDFATVAGYQSQLLTHSINVYENRQDSQPIIIGDYTFIGTNSVILGGAQLPSYSLLAAKSMLSKFYTEEWKVYGGVPAKAISDISRDAKYFSRIEGFVY
jgi:acetyltransferase-like isoleucine patch superfamily enzyme